MPLPLPAPPMTVLGVDGEPPMPGQATSAPADQRGQKLDEGSFRHFRPLLAACQDYAVTSGCRFRSEDFDGIPEYEASPSSCGSAEPLGAKRSRDSGPLLAAKLRAAPVVREFSARLRNGEDNALNEELERAHRVVMAESVRNAIAGMLKALDLFPPVPPPAGISEDDCAYEDCSAPLPVIGQRLYNDEVRRLTDATDDRPGRLEWRAASASFIVDFAEGVGVPLPPIPETQREMLRELAARTAESSPRRQPEGADIFLRGLGVGAVANGLRDEAQKFWAATGGWQGWLAVAAGGVAAVAVAALVQRGQGNREEGRREESPRR